MSAVNQKVVLITGGGRGVGAEVARRLHERGANLLLTDVDEGALAEIAAELGDDRVLTVVADVRDLAAMQAAAAAAVDRFGGVDVVVANAGIATYGSVLQVDPEAFRLLVDINIARRVQHRPGGAALGHRAARLRADRVVCWRHSPRRRVWRRTTPRKAGVEQFANALRLEVAHLGVDVGSAHMSWIDTPLVQDAKSDLPSFRKMLDALPGPLGKTTSVEACGKAFVKGIEGRKTPVYCPD